MISVSMVETGCVALVSVVVVFMALYLIAILVDRVHRCWLRRKYGKPLLITATLLVLSLALAAQAQIIGPQPGVTSTNVWIESYYAGPYCHKFRTTDGKVWTVTDPFLWASVLNWWSEDQLLILLSHGRQHGPALSVQSPRAIEAAQRNNGGGNVVQEDTAVCGLVPARYTLAAKIWQGSDDY